MSADITELRIDGSSDLADRIDRIERIESLLGELEELTKGTVHLASSLLIRLHATLEKAHCVLERVGSAAAEQDGEEDPQPDIDSDMLERMYRRLDAGLPPP